MLKTIDVSQLSKSYDGKIVLRNLSFTAGKGEVLGILGANGAGKSTTIECMLGTRRKDSGSVEILGLDPARERKQLFQKVGVQFQDSNYQREIKVRELCDEISSLYQEPADWENLLEKFGIPEQRVSAVKDLSGGQRQRLFIILALLPNPEILFLDELTTGLDPRGRRDVWDILKGLKQAGMTMVLTSHFMDEVEELCDEILILKKGRMIFKGTVKEAVQASPCEKFEDAYLWLSEEKGVQINEAV